MRLLASSTLCCLMIICLLDGPATACTSFCLDTPDGPFFATNLDLSFGDGHVFVNRRGIAKKGFGESTSGETAKWTSTHGSVTFNLLGREFAWGGINEAGLVVSTMALEGSEYAQPDERPPLGTATWVQYVLDTCSSVQEAIQVDSQVRLQDETPNHYLVVDAEGHCAAIEFLDGRFVCHTGEALPIKALANATYASGVTFVEQGVIPEWNPGASVQRVAAAAKMTQDFSSDIDVSPVDYALGVLTETVVAPKKWWSNLFNEPYTRWSIVFDIARREVHYRTENHHLVRHISLDSFDLSCAAPLLMLDINAKLEGDVDRSFTVYDHDVNLKIFRKFCDRWGIEISKENAVELMQLFESFDCAR
jgi:choloylglycine hydrolase